MTDLARELGKQLNYLRNSAKLFDDGDRSEGIRLGTAMRVLLHEGTGKSLLTMMGAKKSIRLMTTAKGVRTPTPNQPPGMTPLFGFVMGMLRTDQHGTSYVPHLGEGANPFAAFVSVDEWWDMEVWLPDPHTPISRGQIVRWATNKDGGAHVDTDRPAAYLKLLRDPFAGIGLFRADPGTPGDAALVSLRQMAYELLNSPELLALATP